MKPAVSLALALAALGGASAAPQQSGGSGDVGAYAAGLLQALQSANLTMLAQAASSNSDLVPVLQQGGNKTILAPTNEAFAALGMTPSADMLRAVLTYHVLNGTVNVGQVSSSGKNVTYSLLANETYVQLGGRPQVVVFQKASNGTVQVLQAASNVSFASANDGPQFQNLRVQPINQVLTIPGNLSTVVGQLGFQGFAQAASALQLVQPLEQAKQGLTIFVPNDAAFQEVQSTLQSAQPQMVQTILSNHILNGTVAYSTLLTGSNPVRSAVSAAGNNLTFGTGSNGGLTVTSGNITANIVRSDVLVSNGVIHVIDRVLATNTSDPAAANNAFNSATSAAGSQPTGSSPGGSGGSSTGGSNGAGALNVAGAATIAATIFAGAAALLL